MPRDDTNDKYIDRPFNIRPLCLWAFLVCITVIFCFWSILATALWLVALFLLLCLCQYIPTKDRLVLFLGTSRAFFFGTVFLCLAAVLSFGILNLVYTQSRSFAGINTLTGTIEKYQFTSPLQGTSYIVLSGVKFGPTNLNGRVIVFVENFSGADSYETGDKVTLQARLDKADIKNINVNSRVIYYASTDFVDIAVTGASVEVRHAVSRYSKNFLEKYLDSINADLMFSMLFGDKSSLDGELRSDFALTGLAHVLAVSGLHVGIIAGMLTGLLKLCRVRRKFRFPIILLVLLVYCYLCDFNFPILRASIMFTVISGNKIYLRDTDLLSSLSAAAIVTLIIFPYSLFSVSFQLSYACMFGIALFMRPAENLFNRITVKNAPKFILTVQNFLVKGISMYFCVTVATLPLVTKYFEAVPVFGLVSNLFILPLLVLSFQAVIVALLTHIAFPLLNLVNYTVTCVRAAISAISDIPFAQIHVQSTGYWFVFYLAALVFLSRYVFYPGKYKTGWLLLLVYMTSLLIYN